MEGERVGGWGGWEGGEGGVLLAIPESSREPRGGARRRRWRRWRWEWEVVVGCGVWGAARACMRQRSCLFSASMAASCRLRVAAFIVPAGL